MEIWCLGSDFSHRTLKKGNAMNELSTFYLTDFGHNYLLCFWWFKEWACLSLLCSFLHDRVLLPIPPTPEPVEIGLNFTLEKKEGRELSFVSNLTPNFRVLIRPFWPGQVQNLIKDIELDLSYQNQNVRGRQGLKKCQSLILCTVRNVTDRAHASSICPSVVQA